MKYRVIKIVGLMLLFAHLTSCFTSHKGDNRKPSHNKYRRAGRNW